MNARFCPNCNRSGRVVDTMTEKDGSVRRIRFCRDCFKRWETIETVVEGSTRWSFDRKREKRGEKVRYEKRDDTCISR